MRVNIATSVAQMDQIAPLWNSLLQRQEHSVFQRFSWNRLAADFFRDRLTPHIVSVETSSGAAIIPAAINHATNRLELLGETLFDYRDVLHAGDPEALQIAWRELANRGLPLDVLAVEQNAARERWHRLPLEPFVVAPGVRRDLITEAEFRAAHSRSGFRSRRLQRQGVHFRRHNGSEAEVVRQLYHCKRDQIGGAKNLFRDEKRRDFMVALAAMEPECCEIFTLETDNRDIVAGLMALRDARVRRFYTVCFDPQWAQQSPGIVLLYEVTARSLAEGLSCDYMTGEGAHKSRYANAARQLFQLHMTAQQMANFTSLTTASEPRPAVA